MNWFRSLFTFLGLVMIAAIGWYYYQQYIYVDLVGLAGKAESAKTGDFTSSRVGPPSAHQEVSRKIQFPDGAIGDELVIHFRNRRDYLAYLAALAGVDTEPLGQIEELLAVRISTESLSRVDTSLYESEASFSYRIQRPPAPIEIAPEALASLRAFGQSAGSIVGGIVDGGHGEGVLVGILDSGIESHRQFDDTHIVHIDLAGGGVSGPGAGHGTSVASIISGSEGIAPASELFVVRVLDDAGMGSSYDVAQGIVEAVDMGVDILNMSLGIYEDVQILREAVSYAFEKGVVLVAAAGNEAYAQLPFPAAYPNVLAVTAVDASGRQALFPNQSKSIDFAAPGVGVLTAKDDEGTVLFSGTSAAAPFVTGTLAAMLSADPNRSAQQTVEELQLYLNDAGRSGVDAVYGAGLIDWDRLRERKQMGILDVAIADIHLSADTQPGTTMPIEVTVQNRGTAWLSTADLEVMIGENEPLTFSVGSLGPGKITSRKVYAQVPSLDSSDVLQIAARVLPEKIENDVRLQNNLKAVAYRPRN